MTAEPTRAETEAAEWLLLLDSASTPPTEIKRFQAWLSASDENKAAYAAMSDHWDQLGPALLQLPPELRTVPGRPPVPSRKHIVAGGFVAFAAVMVFGLFVPLPAPKAAPREVATFATAPRQGRTITLEDGTQVELSPLARMSVSFSGRERRVEISDGVALFHVAPDVARPFIAATRYGEVRTTAAQFALRTSQAHSTVVVIAGAVLAQAPRGRTLWQRLQTRPLPSAASANEAIEFKPRALAIASLSSQELQTRLAWRDGYIVLDGQTLAEAANEVTRFSGTRFTFVDAATARIRVAGYIRGNDVEAFLQLLQANFEIEADRPATGPIRLRRTSR